MEAVDINAPCQGTFEVSEQVVHLSHAFPVSCIDESARSGLVTDQTAGSIAVGLSEAVVTEVAIAVQDVLSYFAETVLALVSVLGILTNH